jgi:hypothetical protein
MTIPDPCDRPTATAKAMESTMLGQMVEWLDCEISANYPDALQTTLYVLHRYDMLQRIRAELLKSRDAAQPLGASGYDTNAQHGVKSTAPDAPPSALDTELMALLERCEVALRAIRATNVPALEALHAIADFRKGRR